MDLPSGQRLRIRIMQSGIRVKLVTGESLLRRRTCDSIRIRLLSRLSLMGRRLVELRWSHRGWGILWKRGRKLYLPQAWWVDPWNLHVHAWRRLLPTMWPVSCLIDHACSFARHNFSWFQASVQLASSRVWESRSWRTWREWARKCG